MKLKILRGTTSKLIRVFIQDSSVTTGAGLTGLTNASAGLVAYYCREGDNAATAISLSGGTLGTWSSGGFIAVDGTNMPGVYELGLPNAALSTGNSVVVLLKGATNMVPNVSEIELDAVNYQDGVHFGLTSLPNAAAAAAGGLPTFGSSTGQINPSGGNIGLTSPDSALVQSGTAQAGGASTITLAAGASATNNLYNGCVVKIYGGTGAGQQALISSYVGSSKVATISGTWVTNPDNTSTYAVLAVPLGKIWDDVDTAGTHNVANSTGKLLRLINPTSDVIYSGTATAATSTTITLDAGASAVAQAYQWTVISITGGTGAGQSRIITNYTISKVATVQTAWTVTPDATSTFDITPTANVQVSSYIPGQDPGSYVLLTPANKLLTDASGRVTVAGYATGQDPGTYVLATPANKLTTDASGRVTVAGYAASQDPGTYVLATPANKLVTDASGRVNTTYGLHKNTAYNNFAFVMTDNSTHLPKTGLTVSPQRSLDGGAFAACANAVTELANGCYLINLAATDLNANTVVLRFTATGADTLLLIAITQG